VLGVADVHIYAYTRYSDFNDQDIPSRLGNYERLAHDLVHVGREKNCPVLVIAGDLLQASVLPPMTINAAKRFIEVVAAGFQRVIVIPGQHDLDVKIDAGTVDHSIISPIADRVTYHTEPYKGVIELEGYDPLTYFAKPWVPNLTDEYAPADLYIGHGMVSGSKDPYGYVFNRGFDPADLYKNYRLAIIGDIHQSQIFTDSMTEHRILVPGQPIQSNHSSGFPTGAWVMDLNTASPTLEFSACTEWPGAKEYHYFVQEPLAVLKDFPNVHVKDAKVAKPKKKGKDAKDLRSGEKISLIDTLLKFAKEQQFLNSEWATAALKAAYEKASSEILRPLPKRSCLLRVEAANFQSIGDTPFILELDGLSTNNILITSNTNGAGKTTIGEAIYWAITGLLTKNMPVGEISCSETSKPARVTLDLEIDDVPYRFVRSRETGNLLRLYQGDKDITKNKPQEQIYQLLGFQEKDIKVLMYFSLNSAQLFSYLTVTDQLSVIADLAGVDKLDVIATQLASTGDQVREKFLTAESEYNYLSGRVSALSGQIQSLEYDTASENTIDVPTLKEEIRGLTTKLEGVKKTEAEKQTALNAARVKLREVQKLANDEALVHQKISAAEKELEAVSARRRTAKQGTCPECHQALVDANLLASLTKSMTEASARVNQLKTFNFKFSEEQLLGAENDVSLLEAELTQIQPRRQALENGIRSRREQLDTVAESSGSVQRLQLLQEELADAKKKLELNSKTTFENQLADLKTLGKLLNRNNRNPAYLSMLRNTYLDLIDLVNESLAGAEGYPYSLSLGDDYTLKVTDHRDKTFSVGRTSGGERRLLDVAITLRLGTYYDTLYQSGAVMGLRIFDELFVYLNSSNTQVVHSWLQDLTNSINLVMTNDDKVRSLFDSHIFVRKEDGISQYSQHLR